MTEVPDRAGPVLVIGAALNDLIGRPISPLATGTSNPARLRMSPGGVARNIAENLARLGMEVILLTVVGEDPQGEQLLAQTEKAGVNVDYALVAEGQPTGSYLAVLKDDGNLHLALDDMSVMEALTPEHLRACRDLFKQASAVVLDANLPSNSLKTAVSLAWRSKAPICADPTSVSLAPQLKPYLPRLWLITPNEAEAEQFCPNPIHHGDKERAIEASRYLVSHGVKIAIITLAEFGASYAAANASGHVPAVKTDIIDPTGAGDAQTAATLYALLSGIPLDDAVRLGVAAATLTLRTPGSVAPNLSLEVLYDQLP